MTRQGKKPRHPGRETVTRTEILRSLASLTQEIEIIYERIEAEDFSGAWLPILQANQRLSGIKRTINDQHRKGAA